jgi:hypothetical protein
LFNDGGGTLLKALLSRVNDVGCFNLFSPTVSHHTVLRGVSSKRLLDFKCHQSHMPPHHMPLQADKDIDALAASTTVVLEHPKEVRHVGWLGGWVGGSQPQPQSLDIQAIQGGNGTGAIACPSA